MAGNSTMIVSESIAFTIGEEITVMDSTTCVALIMIYQSCQVSLFKKNHPYL